MKSILLLCAGGMALIAGYNNFRYPEINLLFVQHTLSMDTVTPGRHQARAITSPAIHKLAHYTIACAELICGSLCLLGSVLYLLNSAYAKIVATAGLVTGIAIWFGGFRAIAGEWFFMWQSKQWNGLPDGERIVLMLIGMLNFIK